MCIRDRYLSDPKDLWRLVEGCKLAREFAAQPVLSQYVESEYLPGDRTVSDDDWAEHVRAITTSLYHPVGTCAMGTADHDVLDQELRVRGVEGLRVADASVMPSIVNANTQAISMVIGKRCADFITAAG